MADTDATYTAHYNWTKPAVGLSVDVWGTEINTDLDSIDTTVWNVQAAQGNYLLLTGGALTGSLTLAADPAAPLQPATKHYVDSLGIPLGDNRIINGDMRIDQRNNGALVTAGGYTIDRWAIAMSVLSKFSAQRVPSVAMTANGFPYALNFTSSSAYSPTAPDSFFAAQTIEADMVSDFAWGTAGAQPVTLSFWVNVSAAGTYGGSITNSPAPPTRSYAFSFTVPVGWTKVAITIPGDTAGTWVMSGNAGGLSIRFDLGSGAQYRGTAGSWQNGNFNGAIGTAGIVTTNGAVMQITGVKLEIGSVATPFNRQSLAKSMADCQRYYLTSNGNVYCFASYALAGGTILSPVFFPITMRVAPTTALGTPSNVVNISGANVNTIGSQNFVIGGIATAAGPAYYAVTYTASAEL